MDFFVLKVRVTRRKGRRGVRVTRRKGRRPLRGPHAPIPRQESPRGPHAPIPRQKTPRGNSSTLEVHDY